MPRPFYLIAHNPNSVNDAVKCLQQGANAIEPDVLFKENDFYVMEVIPIWSSLFPPGKGPRLADYLMQLQEKIIASQGTDKPLKLSLILFDTKNIDRYNVNTLFEVVRAHFNLPDVRWVVTTGSKKYLPAFARFIPNAANEMVGIDGACSAGDADIFFQGRKMNYTYANGTSLPLITTTAPVYLNQIKSAIQLRDSDQKTKPTLVYAWTVNNANSMRAYLRLGVDGIITDKISQAVKVLKEAQVII